MLLHIAWTEVYLEVCKFEDLFIYFEHVQKRYIYEVNNQHNLFQLSFW